jgi:hypothetical protein
MNATRHGETFGWKHFAGQILLYAVFAAALGYFATSPAYERLAPDRAVLKLSFSHASAPRGECRQRTAEELARLPPNMRAPLDCPRARSPVEIELVLDGERLFYDVLEPRGWQRDGTVSVYRTFVVAAGRHHVRARLKDDLRLADFNYERESEIELAPAQVFVLDFDARGGGFVFR